VLLVIEIQWLSVRAWLEKIVEAVSHNSRVLRVFLVSAFIGPRFAKIAVEFFTEAAVLVAVFPILDTLIEGGGMAKLTESLVAWSEGLAAFFLLLAGIIAKTTGE